MARIRTIKPEFWTSEQVMDCEPVTRLLFIGLWNFVDDFGRAPIAPRTIKAQVMPGDNFTGEDIQAMLVQLQSIGLIKFYSADGKDFFEITGWSKHQKIDNPSKYKVCPTPTSDESQSIAIPSDESPKIVLEGKGKGKRPGKEESIQPVAEATRPVISRFDDFWKEYPKREGDNPRKPAEKKFNALVKTGVDPELIIAGARQASSAARTRGDYGSRFIPQAIKWLNDQRFQDYAVFSCEPAAAINWDSVIEMFKKTGHWSRYAGPDPDSPACRAPLHLLEKHGLRGDSLSINHQSKLQSIPYS